ncbi:TetR/AcrR family transcriptional regulator [Cystobacter fuscus]
MEVFWERGYEGTSITDLTEAMGITAPSLYGAFTSKAELYREALELYQRTHGSAGMPALEEPTARGAMVRVLEGAARAFADTRHPQGCMVSMAVLNCATENQPVARHVAGMREPRWSGSRPGSSGPSPRASCLPPRMPRASPGSMAPSSRACPCRPGTARARRSCGRSPRSH